MKKLFLLVLTLIVTFGLSACGEDNDKVTITFLNGKAEAVDWVDAVILDFEAEYPNIEVVHEFNTDASNALKVKIAGDDIPDITTVYDTALMKDGYYYDLSELEVWDRIDPSIKALCTDPLTGNQYRIATNRTMAGLFYNKDIFTEVGATEPETWAEFVAVLEDVTDAGYDGLYMGGKDTWMIGHLIEFWAHGLIKQELGTVDANVAFLMNQTTLLNFDSANGPMETFAESFLELKDAGLLNDDFLTATYDNQIDAFANGDAAVISQGMWALGGILEKAPELADSIGFMPYPAMDPTKDAVILSAEDSGYAIMEASENKDAAITFLNYLFQADIQKEYSELMKSPSAFIDVIADWSPISAAVESALAKGTHIGFTATPSGFGGGEAGILVQNLYLGEYTVAEFVEEYTDSWNEAWNASN
ncbi:Multiple sugar-binding protein precursor [Candidatus Izimaplasma bacterium HR1]|jgi:raffinose/stachyose/melibiose transport system substrate-binding protein|uniref:ABC transporter substrate-binding protein n=1 Tax=Candidatus Izimoplasma sp. HR1 TaxID=1541959 RepID=UPI0004F68322|nr:Multiple sugar-binding protein precursor [Candidatus Izimaplasma bacterium HR1]